MLLFRDCEEVIDFFICYGFIVFDGCVELNWVLFLELEGLFKIRKLVFIIRKLMVLVGEIVNGGLLFFVFCYIFVCSFNF